MVRVISIISLGEGTGKTTTALNLGLLLHNMNNRVLVFDTDFNKHNMIDHLDIHNLPVDIGHVLDGESHINNAIYKHTTGLRIIPSKIHDYQDLSYHFQDLLGDYDFIILDTPSKQPDLDVVLKNSNEAIIVHHPKYSSKIILDASDLLERHKILNLGIVLNGVVDGSVDEIFQNPVLVKIPEHKDIVRAFALKNPVVYTHPKSLITKRFELLAKLLG